MSDIHAVIFDYGHTIVDFATAEDALAGLYEEIREILVARAFHDLPQASEFVEAVSGTVDRMVLESYEKRQLEELDVVLLFEQALGAIGVTIPRALTREIAEKEHRVLLSRLTASRENLETLSGLRSMGKKIGIVSNAHFLPEMMRGDLERLGIAQYVDAAVFSAEIGVRKPHPAIFLSVLNSLNVQPSEAVFVGDRLRDDVAGAQALGMRGILTHEFRQEKVTAEIAVPDLVIERLPEVLDYVRRESGVSAG